MEIRGEDSGFFVCEDVFEEGLMVVTTVNVWEREALGRQAATTGIGHVSTSKGQTWGTNMT